MYSEYVRRLEQVAMELLWKRHHQAVAFGERAKGEEERD